MSAVSTTRPVEKDRAVQGARRLAAEQVFFPAAAGAIQRAGGCLEARVRAIRNKVDPAHVRALPWITATIALATLVRVSGSTSLVMLSIAATLWSLALLMLLAALLRIPSR